MTPFYLAWTWLHATSEQRERIGHICNRIAQNDMFYAHYHLPRALYPGWRYP